MPDLLLKNGQKFMISQVVMKIHTNQLKKIIFKTSMLRSDLCDFSDAYNVVRGTITIIGISNNSKKKLDL